MAQLAVLRCRACQREQLVASHRAVPPSPPTEYEQFPFFSNLPSFWKQRRQRMERWRCLHLFLSSPCQFSKAPCGPASGSAYRLPTQLVRSSTPPCSRGGRPVSAGSIGKQKPKIYFPVSFPSLMSKYSNGSRKNVAGPQFLLTMISIAAAPRPPSRKFDKSQNL